MITVISPAKKLNLNAPTEAQQTEPSFQHEANYLATEVGKLSMAEQKDLMSISEKFVSKTEERDFEDDEN